MPREMMPPILNGSRRERDPAAYAMANAMADDPRVLGVSAEAIVDACQNLLDTIRVDAALIKSIQS
jgi:hypothetical protein